MQGSIVSEALRRAKSFRIEQNGAKLERGVVRNAETPIEAGRNGVEAGRNGVGSRFW
jgi:hypothetical protein